MPEPALSLQLQLPVKIRKFKFLICSLLRLVSFGQESALQGGSRLKVNLTHCWKPQLHVQPLLLPAFSSPSTAWRPVIPPPPFEGLNSKQIWEQHLHGGTSQRTLLPHSRDTMGCHCLVVTDIHWTEINLLFFKKKYRSYLFYSFFSLSLYLPNYFPQHLPS